MPIHRDVVLLPRERMDDDLEARMAQAGTEGGHRVDHAMVRSIVHAMKPLSVSSAKAGFSGIARRVIKKREPVIVKTPTGYVQIVPFDVPDFVPPAAKGEIQLTRREIELANRLGDSL